MQETQPHQKQPHHRSQNPQTKNQVSRKPQAGPQQSEPPARILLIFVTSEIRRQGSSKKCGSLLQKSQVIKKNPRGL